METGKCNLRTIRKFVNGEWDCQTNKGDGEAPLTEVFIARQRSPGVSWEKRKSGLAELEMKMLWETQKIFEDSVAATLSEKFLSINIENLKLVV